MINSLQKGMGEARGSNFFLIQIEILLACLVIFPLLGNFYNCLTSHL